MTIINSLRTFLHRRKQPLLVQFMAALSLTSATGWLTGTCQAANFEPLQVTGYKEDLIGSDERQRGQKLVKETNY